MSMLIYNNQVKKSESSKNKKKCLKTKKKTEDSYNEKNLPTQEKTTQQSTRIQKENGYQARQKRSKKKKSKRPS